MLDELGYGRVVDDRLRTFYAGVGKRRRARSRRRDALANLLFAVMALVTALLAAGESSLNRPRGRAHVRSGYEDGAANFLTIPVNGANLLVAVRRALEHDHHARQARVERDDTEPASQALTPRAT